MKKTILTLMSGLILTAGTVLALDDDVKKNSDRVVEKLLDLTDRLSRRVTELEKTVEEQKKEIAQLKAERQADKQKQSEILQRLPGQPGPKLLFTPNGTLVPEQRLWTPDGTQVVPPTPPRQPNAIPPGSVPRDINGMRFYIIPVEAGTTSITPGATTIPAQTVTTTQVPIQTVIPAQR